MEFTVTAEMYRLAMKREKLFSEWRQGLDAGALDGGMEEAEQGMKKIEEQFEEIIGHKPSGLDYGYMIDDYRQENPEVFEYNKRKTGEVLNALIDFMSIEIPSDDEHPALIQLCDLLNLHEAGIGISVLHLKEALNRIKDSDL